MADNELFGNSEQLDDPISRRLAIEALAEWHDAAITNRLNNLPSTQPERKRGKWIEMGTNKDGTHSIRCSKCGGGYKTRGHARSIATKAKYKFCPNCGADMRGEQDG